MAADRETVAYHEAGHAVVARHFQLTVDRISIVSDGEAAGHVIHDYGCNMSELADALANDPEEGPFRQWALEREAIVALAGELAQRRFREESVEEWHGGGDRLTVHLVLDHLAGRDDQELREAWETVLVIRTSRVVNDSWPIIEGLASILLKENTIDGVERVKTAIADAALPEEFRGLNLSMSERLAILARQHSNDA